MTVQIELAVDVMPLCQVRRKHCDVKEAKILRASLAA
jgi:hypothetical protein